MRLMLSIIHDPRLSPVPWEPRGEVPPKEEPLNSFPAAWEWLTGFSMRVVLDASVQGLAVWRSPGWPQPPTLGCILLGFLELLLTLHRCKSGH